MNKAREQPSGAHPARTFDSLPNVKGDVSRDLTVGPALGRGGDGRNTRIGLRQVASDCVRLRQTASDCVRLRRGASGASGATLHTVAYPALWV